MSDTGEILKSVGGEGMDTPTTTQMGMDTPAIELLLPEYMYWFFII